MLHKAFAPADVLREGEPGARTTLEPPRFVEARLRDVARAQAGEPATSAALAPTSTLLRGLVLAWTFVALGLGAALGYALAGVS
ncbi:MAG: hypothetical protein AB7P00_10950 [Sandaracinaceae bacterium]